MFVKLKILYFEDVLQDVELLSGIVNADGAATDLAAVQHQVVVLATHLRNILEKGRIELKSVWIKHKNGGGDKNQPLSTLTGANRAKVVLV